MQNMTYFVLKADLATTIGNFDETREMNNTAVSGVVPNEMR